MIELAAPDLPVIKLPRQLFSTLWEEVIWYQNMPSTFEAGDRFHENFANNWMDVIQDVDHNPELNEVVNDGIFCLNTIEAGAAEDGTPTLTVHLYYETDGKSEPVEVSGQVITEG